MKKESQKPLRMLPLVTGEMVPLTDPNELAALECCIREAEKVMVDGYACLKKTKPRKRKAAKA
jgi:hypothetical protein